MSIEILRGRARNGQGRTYEKQDVPDLKQGQRGPLPFRNIRKEKGRLKRLHYYCKLICTDKELLGSIEQRWQSTHSSSRILLAWDTGSSSQPSCPPSHAQCPDHATREQGQPIWQSWYLPSDISCGQYIVKCLLRCYPFITDDLDVLARLTPGFRVGYFIFFPSVRCSS
jgi:hypothetical protein